MTTINFTIKQLACLFTQGINEGETRQCAYDWGCTHGTKWQNAFADAIETLVNDGKKWDDPTRITWDQIQEWIKEV